MTIFHQSDLFIIGGGINGVGIANDAAGRGLSVILCEQGDLASATSSKSSKLIHGGLRYLEYYEFRLVREALKEREILLNKAPHIIHPLQFVMPHNARLKPAWMLRAGLFLYDHLGKRRRLSSSHSIDFNQHPSGQVLKPAFKHGFVYSDCWVDDARLVVLNAMQASDLGAKVLTQTRFLTARRGPRAWEIDLENLTNGQKYKVQAKVLVNAAGPWVDEVIHGRLQMASKNHLSLVKGSHIVTPKLYEGDYAFILINTDNRVIFVIPYLQKFSLIGTTDVVMSPGTIDDPAALHIDSSEMQYLCKAVNDYFSRAISPQDIIWTYSGVRPLHGGEKDNPSAISRDYVLELNTDEKAAPLLSIFGGKITTYRKLAEHALSLLKPFFPDMKPPWTAKIALPGGDFEDSDFETFCENFMRQKPWLPQDLALRYARNYGTLVEKFLHDVQSIEGLGKYFGGGLYEVEVNYLIRHEWAKTVDDILWRRTKLGLFLSDGERDALEGYTLSHT